MKLLTAALNGFVALVAWHEGARFIAFCLAVTALCFLIEAVRIRRAGEEPQ